MQSSSLFSRGGLMWRTFSIMMHLFKCNLTITLATQTTTATVIVNNNHNDIVILNIFMTHNMFLTTFLKFDEYGQMEHTNDIRL